MTRLTAPPGFRPHEAPFGKEHLTYRAREARRDKRAARWLVVLCIAQGGALLSVCYASAYVLPMVRMVPVFLPAADDGTVAGAAVTTDQQPVDLSQRQIKASLWQYVVAHDSYSWGPLKLNIDHVERMSTPDVFKAYRAYVDSKNPNSMVVKLGRDGWVTLKRDPRAELRLNPDGSGQYRVTYWRIQEQVGHPAIRTHWQQDVTFTQNYVVSPADAEGFNPSSVTVTAYPPPEDIGAEPGMMPPLADSGVPQ